ncbi:MAG: TraB/GumN family protein [Chthoniobacterales bacterium]|nr:TraB/GumN family protein [Chthoniobacterales bacterium]
MKRLSLATLLISLLLLIATSRAFADAPAATRSAATRSAATQASRAFLWHITTADGKPAGSLVGSVHLATEDFYPLPDVFYSSFDAADRLVVEVDITKVDQGAMQQMVLKSGMYAPPDGLSKHVAKETMDALKAYGKFPAELTEQMKPWLLATMITMQEIQALGFDPNLGIDQHFLAKAAETKKKVVELETAEAQFKLLSGFDAKLQEKFLSGTLSDMKELKPTMDKVATAWTTGDAEMIEKELIEKSIERNPELKPVMVKLFDDRNAAMASKIDAMIKKGEKPFVVVGAGHLVGEKGLVKLLAKKGYKIEQATVAATVAPTTKPASSQPAGSGR